MDKEKRAVYGWLFSQLKPYFNMAVLFIIITVFVLAVELYIPQIIKNFIDEIIPRKDGHSFTISLIVFFVMVVVLILLHIWIRFIRQFISEHITSNLTGDMLMHHQRLGFSYAENNKIGETLTLFNSELQAVQRMFGSIWPDVISCLARISLGLFFIININWKLSFVIRAYAVHEINWKL